MSNSQTDGEECGGETCHECGSKSSLRAASNDGVFRPVCRECFEEHHSDTRSPPDWKDWGLLSTGLVAGFAADIAGVLSTVDSIGFVGLVFVGWLAMTTVSGAYPWSLPPMGGSR